MGLDICMYKMKKVRGSVPFTFEGVEKANPGCLIFDVCSVAEKPDMQLEGAEDYLFKHSGYVYDIPKIMASLGISEDDGWSVAGDAFDESGLHYMFSKGGEYREQKVFTVEDGIDYDFVVETEFWAILAEKKELAYMRKGANERFYDDGMWDENWMPVCSKRILEEHMEKYFDDGPGYLYENCREAFKNIIYDKFEDGKGLCVLYI